MDSHANFAISTVLAAPSPAASGLSLIVASGTGALFPTPPFNATVWKSGVTPTVLSAEIVRVTGIITDTLAISRAQEGTIARTILIGDKIAATVTAKTLTDIEAAVAGQSGVGPTQTSSGSPVGVKTPAFVGQLCVDLTAPYGLWFSTGVTSADWLMLLGA